MYDKDVLNFFLENQGRLYDEEVAQTPEEADEFLEENMAQVVETIEDVREFFDEMGADIDGMDDDELMEQSEVFKMPDGRFLLIEG